MSYATIDPILQKWSEKYSLHIYTEYQDSEVRSATVVDNSGNKYQIWVEEPTDAGIIKVCAWDYKKRREEFSAEQGTLEAALEKAYKSVSSWMEE